ncbi:MAG: hypothetical protein J5626_05020 [Lachnospiraceae bacterium]|nr:hypothetical protein [Lachnospiraceae bacterium]
MIKEMQKRRDCLYAQMAECLRALEAAPPGKLEIYKNHVGTKWYVKPDDGEREYLPKKEKKTAQILAEKRIAQLRLYAIQKELRAINLYMKHLPNEKELIDLAKRESLFAELLDLRDFESWDKQQFRRNMAFPENLRFPSPSGHLLRSKSECLIDMELFHKKIPFRYECELDLNGNILYPDFTFFNERTGDYKYWEHFGMMDDYRYRKKAMEKIDLYIANGLIPGEDVIFTYETISAPLSPLSIARTISDIELWLG